MRSSRRSNRRATRRRSTRRQRGGEANAAAPKPKGYMVRNKYGNPVFRHNSVFHALRKERMNKIQQELNEIKKNGIVGQEKTKNYTP